MVSKTFSYLTFIVSYITRWKKTANLRLSCYYRVMEVDVC